MNKYLKYFLIAAIVITIIVIIYKKFKPSHVESSDTTDSTPSEADTIILKSEEKAGIKKSPIHKVEVVSAIGKGAYANYPGIKRLFEDGSIQKTSSSTGEFLGTVTGEGTGIRSKMFIVTGGLYIPKAHVTLK